MKILQSIKRWETRLEKAPKSHIARTLVIIFSVWILVGAIVSQSIKMLEVKALEGLTQEIKEIEAKRMQQRIEMMKNIRYAPSQSN